MVTLSKQVNVLLDSMRARVEEEAAGSAGESALRLAGFEAFVRGLYDSQDTPVLGMGFLPNPKALPDTAVRWWYHSSRQPDSRGGLRPLAVGLQPDAMDFYDTTSTEWWHRGATSEGPVVSGPFVDISGTNAYVVTFAQAVRLSERLIGLVAADITVATLQTLCQNHLLDMPRPTSVISSEGMVIATNAGALLGGVVEQEATAQGRSAPISGTSWYLTTAH
ncbi:hypothetical protein GCM10023114_47710 [Mycolicibacterium sediminis]|uniref:Cache domain-containing protein n=1 Tax=Mycolicibacterium sediminis TaxID=1286180 RepID=A0A7I7QNT9_9MYCO|nr:hypothetical protein MSEDJ_15720 [Mycolicibacterium sediminis]